MLSVSSENSATRGRVAESRIHRDNEKGEHDVDDQGSSENRHLQRPHYERLLRLIALLQRGHYVSTDRLCEELQVSERTIQRDIRALRSRGVEIDSTWHKYRLVRSAW